MAVPVSVKSLEMLVGGAMSTTTGPATPADPTWKWPAVAPLGRLKTLTV